ncbi:MAG: hypothetical protein ACRBFS_18165 [Aureispira sp.]
MKSIVFHLLALLAFLLSACNNPSNPAKDTAPERYGFKKVNAYVRYVASQRELQADMTFRTDSTKAIEGLVVINDELMQFKRRPKVGLQYVLNKRVLKFERTQTFAYVEKDGSQQELSGTLPEFDSLRVLSENISHEKGGLLGWNGPAFDDKDGMVLLLTDANGQTFSMNHVGVTQGNTYQIQPSYAQRMAIGPAKIEATRKRTTINQTDNNTQLLTIEYYLLPLSFEVTK